MKFDNNFNVNVAGSQIPFRTVYTKRLPESFNTGKIRSGVRIANGMKVDWRDKKATANFTTKDQTLIFEFSKVLDGPIALHWSLSGDEIDALQKNQILSFYVDDLLNTRNNRFKATRWSRLRFKKSRDMYEFWPSVQRYQNRYVAAKSLNEYGIDFHTAYDIEFSFFVEKNRSKQIKFVNPQIIVQNALSL